MADQPTELKIPDDLQALELPEFHPVSFGFQATSNEIKLIMQRTVLATSKGALSNFAQISPFALIAMSPQTAKDLMLLLSQNIPIYEKENGEIVTDYMRSMKTK